jgi:hypothetical protein
MPPRFVLVHGAWHDAPAWDHLRQALELRGSRSVAVDLPIELPGGHSPMLADPERLADTLLALTRADAREYVRRQ